MCGIIGYTGERAAASVVLDGLKRLEYRGYDSSGIVVLDEGFVVQKAADEVDALADRVDTDTLSGTVGVGHTRWATHGSVSVRNAHPHTCCTGRVAIVHNGIIENYAAVQEELADHDFTSETDSEVIAHFLGERLEAGDAPQEAARAFLERAEGTLAVVAVDRETGALFGFKRGSPLVVGVNGTEHFIGSDAHAFLDATREVVFLEDGEVAVVDGDVAWYDEEGAVDKEPVTLEGDADAVELDGYDHYMRKEIHEQPEALHRLTRSLQNAQADDVADFVELLKEKDKVIFTAAGTSYHASLLGVYFLQRAGIEAQTLIASEFQNYERVDEDTLLVAVSQSGETRDTLDAIDFSRDRGASVASIVNVPHSAIQRDSDVSLEIKAGKEVCVAATKTFSNTVLALLQLAIEAGYEGSIDHIADTMEEVITGNEDTIRDLAAAIAEEDDMYVIGRGVTYPVSREIALKLKEIPYIHAEGMMGGELKHGTLALIEEGTPVLALVPEEDDSIVSNVHEIEARGGNVITVSPHTGPFTLPEDRDGFPFYATTIGFLLSYHIAKELGRPIDKPRNLAKTVTVR